MKLLTSANLFLPRNEGLESNPVCAMTSFCRRLFIILFMSAIGCPYDLSKTSTYWLSLFALFVQRESNKVSCMMDCQLLRS